MSYDSPIAKNQGAAKISEVFTDRALDIIKTQIGESGIKVMEQLVRISGDALRRINYILYSPGTINWTGSAIEFNNIAAAAATNAIFRILQTEDIGAVTSPRYVDLVLAGDQTAAAEQLFKSISMVNGDVIYLELDRSLVLAAGNTKNLHNGIAVLDGGFSSVFTGLTVKKRNISTGLPALDSTEGASPTSTFTIPLAMRIDWTDGVDSFQDIWWIPHGIRWPANTRSTLGGVIVSGLDHYHSKAVASQGQLIQAITDLTTAGGIILVTAPIVLNTPITIPDGVTLTSRSNKYTTAEGGLTLTTGASITLASGAKLYNCDIEGNAGFASSANDQLVILSGDKAEIRDCKFRLTNINPSFTGKCIKIIGTNNMIKNCVFRLGAIVSYRVGIDYNAGTNNTDTESEFLAT